MRRVLSRPAYAVGLAAGISGALFLSVEIFDPALHHVFAAATYLEMHTLLELASIVISVGIFMVNWQSYEERRNAQSLFIGVAFLAVAAVDTLHALSFPGMPMFVTPSSTNKGIVFWLSARLIESLALLGAAFITAQSASPLLRRRPLMAANVVLIGAIFVAGMYYEHALPPLFVEGVGLTPLKVALEYVVIVVNVVAIAAYWRRWQREGEREESIPLLLAALATLVFAELAFTIYQSAYDTYNFLGHVYKAAGYYLIFQALFVTSIERPYRELAKSEAEQNRLYQLEQRKTKELTALSRLLHAPLSLEQVLGAVVRAARELLGAEGTAIMLHDAAGEEFVVAAGEGAAAGTRGQHLPAKGTLAYAVVEAGEARWLDDLREVPEINTPWTVGEFRSLLSAPLRAQGQAIGVLEAYRTIPAAYGRSEAEVLSAFADLAGTALDKAKAHEEIQRLLGEVQAREERLATQNEELQAQAEHIRVQNEELQAQAAHIQAQNEEIQVQNEELAEREQELQRRNTQVEQANRELGHLYTVSQEQAAHMRAIIDAAADGIMVVDGQQKVIAVNPAMEALTGYSAAELTGCPCKYLLDARKGDEESLCDSTCPFLFRLGAGPQSVDATVVRRDGRQVWVNVAYGPIYDSEGRPAAVVHAIRDISARKELERQKDEFLSIAAHDLKNPLTAIKGQAQLLLRRAQREARSAVELEGLRAIDGQVERMVDIINRLLDLTRIQMGRLQLHFEPVDLKQLAERVVAETQVTTEQHQLVLEADSEKVQGRWDRGCLERVLANLVENAIKYSPAGGRVAVTLRSRDGEALVAVKDEGLGIPRDELERVFDRYYRSGTARHEAKGLGLGLYITKSLVEAHGGRIWVESEPGRGSTFWFVIPLEPEGVA